jgi:hypothetical protein
MNCREFEKRWNEVLDARSDGLADLERDLEAHATTCERCQGVSSRYQLLRQAVSAWGPPPVPSIASRQRLNSLSVPPKPRKVVRRWSRIASPMATAAAVFGLAGIAGFWWLSRPIPQPLGAPSIASTESRRPIESAFEEATSATINLALEASAPAARIGRDVLTFEEASGSSASSEPETETGLVAAVSATDMLQTVGERVKPISGSARHAFSFLLGPPPEPEKPSNAPRGSL